MFNKAILKDIICKYKSDFNSFHWEDEKYKWEAVKWFQDNWDLEADDFAKMLHISLDKTSNLLASANNFPRGMIEKFAEKSPEEVRKMFSELFDESRDLYDRVNTFKEKSETILKKYGEGAAQHYQNENSIMTYLWLKYPDKYYIYKLKEIRKITAALEFDYIFKKGRYKDNLYNFMELYDGINAELKKDNELIELLKSALTDECYSDPELKTLTVDLGFYISRYFGHEPDLQTGEIHYWWLNANPKMWSFSNLAVSEEQSYTLYNDSDHKRRIFQNFLDAKEGDLVIGYESYPVKQIVALAQVSKEQDGNEIYFRKKEALASPIDYKTLKDCPQLQNMEYFINPQGSLFKLTKEEFDFIMEIIRDENPIVKNKASETYTKKDFLKEVYISSDEYDILRGILENKKNVILQGAPGVGKTFAAKRLAYSMMGKKDDDKIEFVEFHQNYSYEDFVMGYRPSENGFELKYGIFYRFCQKAVNQPDKKFFFIIDEINRGNLSKIFGELLMLIEKDYRGTEVMMAYNGMPFSIPENLYIIGMMNTADRSLALIDYALRRRFSFYDMEPAFDSKGFKKYQSEINNDKFNAVIDKIKELNNEIKSDNSLGKGFCIGHSYFCSCKAYDDKWLKLVVNYDILPMLSEYWFDDADKVEKWKKSLNEVF